MADMQRIKRELKYAGAVVDVYADTMKFKNGNTEVWELLYVQLFAELPLSL